MIARVLLPLPSDQTFDFLVPLELEKTIAVGKRVRIRFQESERWGIVADLAQESDHPGPLEPVVEVIAAPTFTPGALTFCADIARHYLSPLGPVVNRMLPHRTSGRSDRFFALARGLEEIASHLESLSRRARRQAMVLRFLLAETGPCSEADMRQQLGSVRQVLDRLMEQGWVRRVEPPGLTPSGAPGERPAWVDQLVERIPDKGESLLFARRRWNVYARLIEAALTDSKNVLVLAPEILIASQLHSVLCDVFGGGVDLYHSSLPEGKRGDVWERARNGNAHLIVGTRSALFLPLTGLGVVILDEEQDWSYKQEEMLPYYHARTVARKRLERGLLVLGSSAPSLETFHEAQRGGVALVRHEEHESEGTVHVVDMSKEGGILSESLVEAIDQTVSGGKQVLVGVNRRGYFQAVLCKACGRPVRCPDCGVNVTYHVQRTVLVCRVCGKTREPMRCSNCGARALRFVGVGSERVEHELRERFPGVRVVRIDTDSLQTHLSNGVAEDADILVATPILAKGPPLPSLGLVAAVGVDALLAIPNFRSAERTYQYLTGLIGRLEVGDAIIQTRYPDHYAVRAVAGGDYDQFAEQELHERQELYYPPFSHLARLLLTSRSAAKRRKDLAQLDADLHRFEVEVLGPVRHPFRRGCETLLVKGPDFEVVRTACAAVREQQSSLEIDLDPFWI